MFVFNQKSRPMVSLVGEVNVSSPNEHFRRKPVEYILYMIQSGTMQLVEGDSTYTLRRNDVILLDPTRVHYGIETFSDVHYSYLHFICDGVEEISDLDGALESIMIENRLAETEERLLVPKYMHLSDYEGNRVASLAQHAGREFQDKSIYYRRRINDLLLEVLTIVARAYAGKIATRKDQRQDVTLMIIDYIRTHYQEKFTGEDLERALHMNFDYMNRSFKKKTGYTIMYYTNLFRVNEAKALLRSGTCNVGQAANETGFANEFYFSRVFKKYEGISPSAYLCYICE